MSKFNIISWDDINYVHSLLSSSDTALINSIDVSGTGETLKIGSVDADNIILGKIGNVVIVSGSSLLMGAKVTDSIDLPGQQFKIDGIAVSSSNFTADNITRLLNGSNVSDLHNHSASIVETIQDTNIVRLFPVKTGLTGTQVVYLDGISAQSASADTLATSRIIGVVSGTISTFYNSGSNAKIYTMYGDVFGGFSSLIPGSVYYLNATPNGSIVITPPAKKNVVEIGIAKSTTEIIFQPQIVTKV